MSSRRNSFLSTLGVFLVVLIAGISPNDGLAQISPQSPVSTGQLAQRQWVDNPWGIPVTRWLDFDGRKPTSYAEWRSRNSVSEPFSAQLIQESASDKSAAAGALVGLFVNASLYPEITASLDQYIGDLVVDGYTVAVYTVSGGTPVDFRSLLQYRHGVDSMMGAVLIGDLPLAWYEAGCWDPLEHEEFPCDLYYMDMDGFWEDRDADGLFDSHSGDLGPEIWVGRLTASPMTYGGADEATLLQNYFTKNHAYRTGQMILNDRALVFIDDDWEPYASEWEGNVVWAYLDRTGISDPYETTAPNYASRLPQNYESILLCAHSSPNTHWFKIPPSDWTIIDYNQVVDIDPVTLFYNLFACSNARYVETNYMAGWYIFCQTYGLASIGSTKTGSMLSFASFYKPFGEGKSIGQSFSGWFSAMAADGMEDWEICWFYGMTLCGDPTLVRHMFAYPSILTTFLPEGDYSETYLAAFAGGGGIPPYRWRILNGALPAGLALTEETGIIAGVPTGVGNFSITVEMRDAATIPHADTALFAFRINYVCGDANADGAANVADAVCLINRIFLGGTTAGSEAACDANCDAQVNVGDVVYLINFVFKGGSAPCCRL
jgi:hypothetical protein